MRTAENLSGAEQNVLKELRSHLKEEFPTWSFRMTLFGSRARGDAEPDSDMDILLEIETDHIVFAEKQRVRRIAGEISLKTGIIVSVLLLDQQQQRERGDYSIFQNIREEGIPV